MSNEAWALAILKDRPMHPYELYRQCHRTTGYHHPPSLQAVYRLVTKLTNVGLIEATAEVVSTRNGHLTRRYQLTKFGLTRLQHHIEEATGYSAVARISEADIDRYWDGSRVEVTDDHP